MYHDDVPIIVYYDANVDAVAIHHLSHLLPSQSHALQYTEEMLPWSCWEKEMLDIYM